MVLLQTCCCCIDLRKGAIIIGALGLILLVLVCTFSGYMYYPILSNMHYGYTDEPLSIFYLVLNTFVISIAITGIIFSILIIYGALKRKHSFILSWLIAKGVTIVIELISAISMSTVLQIQGDTMMVLGGAFAFVVTIVIAGIEIYFYLCVFSCYQKIRDENLTNVQDTPICRYNIENDVPYVSIEENKK